MGYYFLSRKRKGEEKEDQKRGVGRMEKEAQCSDPKTLDPVPLYPWKIFSAHLEKIVSKYVFLNHGAQCCSFSLFFPRTNSGKMTVVVGFREKN